MTTLSDEDVRRLAEKLLDKPERACWPETQPLARWVLDRIGRVDKEVVKTDLLEDARVNDGGLFNVGWYLSWTPGRECATLDGLFSAADLAAIANHMERATLLTKLRGTAEPQGATSAVPSK